MATYLARSNLATATPARRNPPAPTHWRAAECRNTALRIASQQCARFRQAVVTRYQRGDSSEVPGFNPQPRVLATADEAIVEEIMAPHPVTCGVNMTCKQAARILLDNDINSMPVVDDQGHLLGMLSEADLIWKGAGAPLDHTIIPPVFVGAFDLLISLRDDQAIKAEIDKILARCVGDAMSKKPVTIRPADTLSRAASVLLAAKVHTLPVVDDNGKVVGVLSQHDVLRGMVAEQLPML